MALNSWGTINHDDFINERFSALQSIEAKLKQLGLSRFSQERFVTKNSIFDGVYLSTNLRQAVFVKSGLKLNNVNEQEGSLFSIRTYETDFTIIALNFSSSEIYHLKNIFNQKKQSSSFFSFVANVYAEENCEPSTQAPLSKLNSEVEKHSVREKIGSCLDHALIGASKAISEQVEFYKKVMTNPSLLIKEAKETFEALKLLIQNLESEAIKTFHGLSHLPEKLKLDLICEMTSSTALLITQSLYLGPSQLVRKLPKIMEQFRKIPEKFERLSRVSKKHLSDKEKNIILSEAISCAH